MDVGLYNKALNALSDGEIRLLGTLCEKQLLGSRSYPLTVNDTRLACNQKSGRNPRTSMSSSEIRDAARRLAARELITIDRSGRTERYAHRANERLGIDNSTLALVTVLCLRGPLSVAQAASAASRLHDVGSKREVETMLNTSKMFSIAPRKPGQRGHRYICQIDAAPVKQDPHLTTAIMGNRIAGVRHDHDRVPSLLEPGRINLRQRS